MIRIAAENDDENLEKLLKRLNNWSTLKISEKLNTHKVKKQLNEDTWRIINHKFAYKGKNWYFFMNIKSKNNDTSATEISPEDSFALWSDTDSNTNGGNCKFVALIEYILTFLFFSLRVILLVRTKRALR